MLARQNSWSCCVDNKLLRECSYFWHYCNFLNIRSLPKNVTLYIHCVLCGSHAQLGCCHRYDRIPWWYISFLSAKLVTLFNGNCNRNFSSSHFKYASRVTHFSGVLTGFQTVANCYLWGCKRSKKGGQSMTIVQTSCILMLLLCCCVLLSPC